MDTAVLTSETIVVGMLFLVHSTLSIISAALILDPVIS